METAVGRNCGKEWDGAQFTEVVSEAKAFLAGEARIFE